MSMTSRFCGEDSPPLVGVGGITAYPLSFCVWMYRLTVSSLMWPTVPK